MFVNAILKNLLLFCQTVSAGIEVETESELVEVLKKLLARAFKTYVRVFPAGIVSSSLKVHLHNPLLLASLD